MKTKNTSENSMQKLNPDELGTVAGGISVGEILAADKSAGGLPAHAASMSFGSDEKGGLSGLTDAGIQGTGSTQNGQSTFQAMCPACGRMTPHLPLSGARAKCTVCGKVQFNI